MDSNNNSLPNESENKANSHKTIDIARDMNVEQPKRMSHSSTEDIELKDLKQNMDGSVTCLKCNKTYAKFHYAKRHLKELHLNVCT